MAAGFARAAQRGGRVEPVEQPAGVAAQLGPGLAAQVGQRRLLHPGEGLRIVGAGGGLDQLGDVVVGQVPAVKRAFERRQQGAQPLRPVDPVLRQAQRLA